jgi:hypothetical protein
MQIVEAIEYLEKKRLLIIDIELNQETMEVDVLLSNRTYSNRELNHIYNSTELQDLKKQFLYKVENKTEVKSKLNQHEDYKTFGQR